MKVRGQAKDESLRDQTCAVAYLRKCAQGGHARFYIALREVVQAREGGFTWLAKQSGLGRASLYKALSEHGNPSYTTVHRVLEALGLDLPFAGLYHTMKPTTLNHSSLIKDKIGVEYNAAAQMEEAPPMTRIQPGSAKGLKYFMAEAFNAPISTSDEAEQERHRALTQQLYAESDAIERQPGKFSKPDKARVAEMIVEKHRHIGLKI